MFERIPAQTRTHGEHDGKQHDSDECGEGYAHSSFGISLFRKMNVTIKLLCHCERSEAIPFIQKAFIGQGDCFGPLH